MQKPFKILHWMRNTFRNISLILHDFTFKSVFLHREARNPFVCPYPLSTAWGQLDIRSECGKVVQRNIELGAKIYVPCPKFGNSWMKHHHESGDGHESMWVCLKMLCTPLYPMVLLIIIPMKNGYFIGNINPTFSDKAMFIWICPFILGLRCHS